MVLCFLRTLSLPRLSVAAAVRLVPVRQAAEGPQTYKSRRKLNGGRRPLRLSTFIKQARCVSRKKLNVVPCCFPMRIAGVPSAEHDIAVGALSIRVEHSMGLAWNLVWANLKIERVPLKFPPSIPR